MPRHPVRLRAPLLGAVLLATIGACATDGSSEDAASGGAGGSPPSGGAGGALSGAGAGARGGTAGLASGGTAGLASAGTTADGARSSGGAPASGGAAGSGGSGAGAGQGGAPSVGGAGGADGAGSGGSGGASGQAGSGGSAAGGGAGESSGGSAAGGGSAGGAGASGDPSFWIFLLLGQSNMEGQPQPQAQDQEQDPRIQVLAYEDCQAVGREYGEWYTASPPLHSCGGGVGPGDYFAKTLLASLPEGHRIGLVPCAVNGAPIDLFRKDVPRTGYELPPDNHWETGYEWIISRAREAQKAGVIRGILFHQGESDNMQAAWVGKVSGLVGDLRSDLGVGEVPFLAGELYYDGCCAGHNALVADVTEAVPNAFLVSASGLGGYDIYHFDLAAQRELGTRYGAAMRAALMLP